MEDGLHRAMTPRAYWFGWGVVVFFAVVVMAAYPFYWRLVTK